MRIIGAYMLAYLGGNANPDAAAVTSILDSIGEKPDEERLKLFMSQVEGKDIADIIEAGSKKLGAVPSGRTLHRDHINTQRLSVSDSILRNLFFF